MTDNEHTQHERTQDEVTWPDQMQHEETGMTEDVVSWCERTCCMITKTDNKCQSSDDMVRSDSPCHAAFIGTCATLFPAFMTKPFTPFTRCNGQVLTCLLHLFRFGIKHPSCPNRNHHAQPSTSTDTTNSHWFCRGDIG